MILLGKRADLNDIIGNRFGRLTVVSLDENSKGRIKYICMCDCGIQVYVERSNLLSGNTKSCGCYRRELQRDTHMIHGGNGNRGQDNSERLYRIWRNMKTRCSNPNAKEYYRYGGRGIKVCDSWLDNYQTFKTWALSAGYYDTLTIDRISIDGDYCPDNCRWISISQQQKNRSTCHLVTINGTTKCLRDWCDSYGMKYSTVSSRIRYGWDEIKALTTPVANECKKQCSVMDACPAKEAVLYG